MCGFLCGARLWPAVNFSGGQEIGRTQHRAHTPTPRKRNSRNAFPSPPLPLFPRTEHPNSAIKRNFSLPLDLILRLVRPASTYILVLSTAAHQTRHQSQEILPTQNEQRNATMATFSKTTFDAAAYLAFRPSYPKWVSEKVLTYHFGSRTPSSSARSSLALDLGCGPGISTLSLLPHFDRVIGLDPSSKMVDAAITPDTPGLPSSLVPSASDGSKGKLGKVEYRQGYSEELSFLEDSSVDLVTSGQAAHWFDYPKLWKELTRVVRPGGSVCLYGYPDFFLPDFPSTRRLLNRFALKDGHGPGSPKLGPVDKEDRIDSIGEYWEQPGRSIVNQGLNPVPFPTGPQWDAETAFKRTFSTQGLTKEQVWSSWPALTTSPLDAPGLTNEVRSEFEGEQEAATMDKHLSWDQLKSYLRTWSATHTYLTEHPGDKEKNGGKDVVDRFVERLRQEVTKENGGKEVEELHLRWPLCFVMIKKKEV